jgi:CheY-like chemotaxis protein
MSLPSILLVEDEPLFRDVAVQTLRLALPQAEVLSAQNGREAIARISTRDPTVVVTDLHMPEVDGFAVLEYLARRRSAASIIVMSAFLDEDHERRAAAVGAIMFLEKPVALDRLTATVEHLLARRRTGHVEGVTLPGFVQLLGMERKNVTLRVEAEDGSGTGLLHFTNGELTDAWDGERAGEEAAISILAWDARIDVVTPRLSDRHTVQSSTMHLVMESARVKDEKQARARRRTDSLRFDFDPSEIFASVPELEQLPLPKAAAPAAPSPTSPSIATHRSYNMASISQSLEAVMSIDGAFGASLIDWTSGLDLGHVGGAGRLNMELAGSLNCEVVRAKMKAMEALGIKGGIDDILITLDDQYHLIRPLRSAPQLFLYLAMDKAKGNLGLARMKLQQVERSLVV